MTNENSSERGVQRVRIFDLNLGQICHQAFDNSHLSYGKLEKTRNAHE